MPLRCGRVSLRYAFLIYRFISTIFSRYFNTEASLLVMQRSIPLILTLTSAWGVRLQTFWCTLLCQDARDAWWLFPLIAFLRHHQSRQHISKYHWHNATTTTHVYFQEALISVKLGRNFSTASSSRIFCFDFIYSLHLFLSREQLRRWLMKMIF